MMFTQCSIRDPHRLSWTRTGDEGAKTQTFLYCIRVSRDYSLSSFPSTLVRLGASQSREVALTASNAKHKKSPLKSKVFTLRAQIYDKFFVSLSLLSKAFHGLLNCI